MDSSSQKKPFNRGRSPFHYIQIHLSTAIVLMFVAGGLVGANTYEYSVAKRENLSLALFGFPVPMGVAVHNPDNTVSSPPLEWHDGFLAVDSLKAIFTVSASLINFAAVACILCLTAFMCELWLYRTGSQTLALLKIELRVTTLRVASLAASALLALNLLHMDIHAGGEFSCGWPMKYLSITPYFLIFAQIQYSALIIDLLTAAATLFAISILCEWLLRRRESLKIQA